MRKTKLFFLLCVIVASTLYGQGFPNQIFTSIAILFWLTTGIIFSAIGIFFILFSQIALAVKEMALNSRNAIEKDENKGKEEYKLVESLVPFLKVIGIVIIVAGWLYPLINKFLFP